MTSAAFADDVAVGTVFDDARAEKETLRESSPTASAVPIAAVSVGSRLRLWLHDFTVVSLLAGVQFSWILVLAYGVYWLVS
jgi:hypothetical protein